MEVLYENILMLDWKQVVMWIIGGVLIYLAIKKQMEPSLLLPMGFGAILVNLPLSGAVTQIYESGTEIGVLDELFSAGIANELFPLILFIGIGAMIDFGPLLSNPKLMIFGAAAQFGIFFTLCMAALLGFELKDAASIAIIGAADGPTSIFVAQYLNSNYIRRDYGRGLFVHGARADHPAARHSAFDDEKRAYDPHALRTQRGLENARAFSSRSALPSSRALSRRAASHSSAF